MSKVNMDMTEYEALKKNGRLLEDALKHERVLKDQIESLHKEKVQALEDAKMKVVRVERREVTEHLMRTHESGPESCHRHENAPTTQSGQR